MHSTDRIDERRAQWAKQLPAVDTVGMAILGRARWLTLKVRGPIEAVFAKAGLDTGEFDVIATLLRCGPPYRMRPTELYRSLMISSGGLTDRLTRLERAGLIRRGSSEGDARSLPVELTTLGMVRAEAVFREDMQTESQLLAALSAEEKRQLERLLRKLVLVLDQDGSAAGPPAREPKAKQRGVR